jgi:1,4-alpha-glucan branching enzyme
MKSNSTPNDRLSELLRRDPYLNPYAEKIRERIMRLMEAEKEIIQEAGSLEDFSSGHEYFGLHRRGNA